MSRVLADRWPGARDRSGTPGRRSPIDLSQRLSVFEVVDPYVCDRRVVHGEFPVVVVAQKMTRTSMVRGRELWGLPGDDEAGPNRDAGH